LKTGFSWAGSPAARRATSVEVRIDRFMVIK
jgi:hypothetical protein